jgi:hypothetical protein
MSPSNNSNKALAIWPAARTQAAVTADKASIDAHNRFQSKSDMSIWAIALVAVCAVVYLSVG